MKALLILLISVQGSAWSVADLSVGRPTDSVREVGCVFFLRSRREQVNEDRSLVESFLVAICSGGHLKEDCKSKVVLAQSCIGTACADTMGSRIASFDCLAAILQ